MKRCDEAIRHRAATHSSHGVEDSAEETLLRWIFRGALAVTVAVLALDLANHQGSDRPGPTVRLRRPKSASLYPSSICRALCPQFWRRYCPAATSAWLPLPQPDGALARPDDFRPGRRRQADGDGHDHAGNCGELRRRGRPPRRLYQDRGAEFAGRLGGRRDGDRPPDTGEEIRNGSRSGKILRLVVSAGVRRWNRATRRREGRHRRSSGGGAAFGCEPRTSATR